MIIASPVTRKRVSALSEAAAMESMLIAPVAQ
jgi:hypothetical protein